MRSSGLWTQAYSGSHGRRCVLLVTASKFDLLTFFQVMYFHGELDILDNLVLVMIRHGTVPECFGH